MKLNILYLSCSLCLNFFHLLTRKPNLEKLEAQWAEPVSLTFHSALGKLNTEPPIGASHQVLVIWLNSYKEEDI